MKKFIYFSVTGDRKKSMSDKWLLTEDMCSGYNRIPFCKYKA